MHEPTPSKPLISYGWLRALLFCVLYLGFILWGQRAFLFLEGKLKGQEPPPLDLQTSNFTQIGAVVFLAMVVSLMLVWLCRRVLDRQNLASLGLSFEGYADPLTGLLLGVALLGTGTLVMYLSHHLQWTDITWDANAMFIELGICAMIALYEEIVFRGYILRNLMDSLNRWLALGISALIFALFHAGSPSIGILPLLNIFLAGLLLGINYLYTKNLWFAILLHLGWNFFQGPILGFKVSGINFSTLLQPELSGDALLTGGAFGFEGSIFDLALTVVAILLLYWAYEKKYQIPVPLEANTGADSLDRH
jgi:uncharacterized protein